MALVDDEQRVRGQIIEQARRRLTGRAARQVAGIILDAGAVADLVHHLEVEQGPLLQALRLDQLVRRVQLEQPCTELFADLVDGGVYALFRGHVMRGRIDRQPRHPPQHLAGQRVEEAQILHGIVEQLDPHRFALRLGREHIDDIAAHAVAALAEVHLVARVLHVGEAAQEFALINALAP
jgi:hypothetical protein